MSDSMDATRRQLRRYLIPSAAAPESPEEYELDDGNHFPRSKVMRFVFNPRNRSLLKLSAPILGVLATRALGADRLSLVTDIARSFKRNKS